MLRDQFEVARRQVDLHGTTTSLSEVRGKIVLALDMVRERLQPIDTAAARHDVAWLAATYTNWASEGRMLRDEEQELQRLLDYVDLSLNALAT